MAPQPSMQPGERRPLLSDATQATEPRESFSSFPEVGAAGRSASAGSMNSSNASEVLSSRWRAFAIIASLGILVFLQASNISLLTTTQGVIAADLDAFEQTSWFTSTYLVALSSISPLTGKLSYIVTPRYCMFLSTIILGIGSIVTGLAPSLKVFLLGRAISGTGAAGILSVAIILVIQLTSPKRRGLFIGILNTGFTIGVAVGAVAAGAIEPVFGWRVLFWTQGPLALLGGVGLLFSIPKSLSANSANNNYQNKTALQKLLEVDYLGSLLLVLCIVSLLYGLSTPQIEAPPILASIAIFPLFLFHELYRHPDPIIPVAVLGSRGALLSCLATLGFMMSRWAVLFYTPIFTIAVRGWSPATAGSILVPTNVGFALGGLLSGGVHIRRTGSWYIACLVVFALFPMSLLALAFASTQTSPTWVIIVCTFVNGLFAGAALNYTLHHVLYLVLPEVRFIVTALLATFRGFAGTFGSAIGGGIFVRVLGQSLEKGFREIGIDHRRDLIRRLLGSPREVRSLHGEEKKVAITAYTTAIQALFFAGVALSIGMLVVQAGTGWKGPVRDGTRVSTPVDEELEGEAV